MNRRSETVSGPWMTWVFLLLYSITWRLLLGALMCRSVLVVCRLMAVKMNGIHWRTYSRLVLMPSGLQSVLLVMQSGCRFSWTVNSREFLQTHIVAVIVYILSGVEMDSVHVFSIPWSEGWLHCGQSSSDLLCWLLPVTCNPIQVQAAMFSEFCQSI